MGFAVYHMEKGSVNSGGIGNHIDRKEGKEFSYRQADPERKHLNNHFKYDNIPLNEAIEKRIKQGYKGKKALRSDAVKYVTHVLSGTHEDMKKIFSKKETAQKWIKENFEFLKKEYGKDNIVRFSLHMDEKTPHIHAVTIPLTEDGRLSAKEVIGNRTKMQERQDRYAEAMKEFGLERGIRSTGIEHENAKEYYARMEESNKKAKESGIGIEKNILGVYTENSINALKTDYLGLKTAYLKLQSEQEKTKLRNISINKLFESEKKHRERVIFSRDKLTKDIKALLNNPEQLNKALVAAIERREKEVKKKPKNLQQLKAESKYNNKQKGDIKM